MPPLADSGGLTVIDLLPVAPSQVALISILPVRLLEVSRSLACPAPLVVLGGVSGLNSLWPGYFSEKVTERPLTEPPLPLLKVAVIQV